MIIYFRSNLASRINIKSYTQDFFEPQYFISYIHNAYVNGIISFPIYHDPMENQAYYVCVRGFNSRRVRYQKSAGLIYRVVTQNELVSEELVFCSRTEIQTILIHSL